MANAFDLAKLGLQVGSLANPTAGIAASAGLGAVGAVGDLLYKDPYEKRIAERIRELEMREAGLTPEEASVYRQSMNAPAIEEAAAASARKQASLALHGGSSGAMQREMQEKEGIEAGQLQKTELSLMNAGLQADADKERELDRLYKEQAGLAEDPTKSMLDFADEVEYQVEGAAREASMEEQLLNYLKGEGLDGTKEQRDELTGFFSYLGAIKGAM